MQLLGVVNQYKKQLRVAERRKTDASGYMTRKQDLSLGTGIRALAVSLKPMEVIMDEKVAQGKRG